MSTENSPMEDSLIERYVDDVKEHMETLESDILSLENDSSAIDSIFRVIHSIKGSAGMFGFMELSKLAHSMENILANIRSGISTPTTDVIDVLLEGNDFFTKAFKDLNNCKKLDYSTMHQKIDSLLVRSNSKARKKIDPPVSFVLKMDIATAGKKRILVVEDNAVNKRFLLESINSIGGNIETVAVDSAASGIYYFFKEHFDLIFLDIMMPNIDGNIFISIIEENLKEGLLARRPNIVVETAIHSIDSLSVLAQNECVQEILRKPLNLDKIIEVVHKYCYS